MGRREAQSGLQEEVHASGTALCLLSAVPAACTALQYAHLSWERRPRQRAKRGRAMVYLGNVWVGCINQNLIIGSSIPLLCSPHAQSIVRTSNAHISHTHAPANTSGQPTAACQDIGCKHLASPLHIGWGRVRILPLRIRATVQRNLASAVGPSPSHLQQFQTEKGPQTIEMPTSHD